MNDQLVRLCMFDKEEADLKANLYPSVRQRNGWINSVVRKGAMGIHRITKLFSLDLVSL